MNGTNCTNVMTLWLCCCIRCAVGCWNTGPVRIH